jgi:hypothetical protein
MSFSSDFSFSEELNKSYDSSNLIENDIVQEDCEEESIQYSEENITNKRRISKISLQMEELKNKKKITSELNDDISTDEYDIECDENSRETKQSVNSVNLYENIFSKFDIEFLFKFNKKEFIISIESDVFNLNKNKVEDLIKNAIKKINEKNFSFKENKNTYIISLKDCEEDTDKEFYKDNYEITKNYSINYPYELLLNEIKDTKLNLNCKNSLNFMIRKI